MERSFAEAAGQKLEVLIVLGGDGTIRAAAETCAEKGSYLIPLLGGTMNMLPRALYGDVAWEESFKNTLAAPSLKVLSGGRIAGKQFLIAAIMGAPALLAEPRESLREGNIVNAIEKRSVAFRKMFKTKIQDLTFGKWRDHRNILLTRTKTMRVQSRNDIPAILDGEKINLGGSTEITFVPKAVTVLVPACR
jgi:diacylglycerol kinase family enzyme